MGLRMQLLPLTLLSLFFGSAAAQRQLYGIVHPAHDITKPEHDIFASFQDVSQMAPETVMHTPEQDITFANLTKSEADIIRNNLKSVNGFITANQQIFLEDVKPSTGRNLRRNLQTEYLSDVPKCNGALQGVDIVDLDTAVNVSAPELIGMRIKYIYTLSDDTPVATIPHATEVLSVIFGKNYGMIPNGDRIAYVAQIFDSNGVGTVYSMVQGFSAAISFAATNRKENERATLINVPGDSSSNQIINAAASAAVNSGVPVINSAGNALDGGAPQNSCQMVSPAQAAGVIAIGATQPPGDIAAYFSDFDSPSNPCITASFPGIVTVGNPNGGGTITVYGTSFAAPGATAWGALWCSADPLVLCTPIKIQNALADNTVEVNSLHVMLVNNACPKSIAPTAPPSTTQTIPLPNTVDDQFHKWIDMPTTNGFCLQFSAQTTLTAPIIALRSKSNDAQTIRVTIGRGTQTKGIFEHEIEEENRLLNHTFTTRRYVNRHTESTFRIQQDPSKKLTLYYENVNELQELVSTKLNENLEEMAFGSRGSGVTYLSANPC